MENSKTQERRVSLTTPPQPDLQRYDRAGRQLNISLSSLEKFTRGDANKANSERWL